MCQTALQHSRIYLSDPWHLKKGTRCRKSINEQNPLAYWKRKQTWWVKKIGKEKATKVFLEPNFANKKRLTKANSQSHTPRCVFVYVCVCVNTCSRVFVGLQSQPPRWQCVAILFRDNAPTHQLCNGWAPSQPSAEPSQRKLSQSGQEWMKKELAHACLTIFFYF